MLTAECSSPQFPGLFLNSPPGVSHVPLGGICLPDAKPQRCPVIQASMGQIKIAAAVERFDQSLVSLLAAFQAEANQIQRCRCGQLEPIIVANPGGKLLREANVLADVKLQAFNSVVPQHEP